jgi:rod shape-determining protein MreD
MKSRVYLIVLVLLIPVQASLLAPLANLGLRPDLGLAAVYAIGLLTGPGEGALAGIAVGLLLDIGSASPIGLSGLTHGIAGFFAGLLGRRVLDVRSPSNVVFLPLLSIAQALLAASFLEMTYGSVPILSQFVRRMVPQAAATTAAGYLLLRFTLRRPVRAWMRRRELQKES